MKGIDRRIQGITVFLLICFAILFLQLNNLQFKSASGLVNSQYNGRTHSILLTLPRGSIVASDGTVLATSVPSHDIYKQQREYPLGELFADITGYDSIFYGVTGVEAEYDQYLKTHSNTGTSVSNILTNQETTDDVVLTVSPQLQKVAEQALANVQEGAVVAINPKTGAILAMYGKPTFDPNPIVSHSIPTEKAAVAALNPYTDTTPLRSMAYGRTFFPGSTFKIITSSAVFDHMPNLATQFIPYMNSLALPNSNQLLHNFGGETCGGVMSYLLEVSCDTGFGQIGLDLGADNLAGEANAFGFNQAPPIDLTGVSASVFPSAASFATQKPFLAYSAIGQGNVKASVLQMVLAGAAIANNGVIMTPHVMERIQDSLGQTVQTYTPKPWLYATTPATAASVTADMQLVVSGPRGTANIGLFPPNQGIAAKTGTAQNGVGQGNNNWLVAFGPNGNGQSPSVVVAAVVPYYPGLGFNTQGATTAGPIAAAVLEAALNMGL